MLQTVLAIHGLVRYAVLLGGVAALVAGALAWRRATDAPSADGRVMAVFVGLLDLQVLVGIVLLVLRGFYGALMGHLVMMVAAVAVAHVGSARARRAASPAAAGQARVIAAAAALALIVGGILAIGRPIV